MCLQLSQRLKRLPNQHTICYLVGDEGLLFVPASGQLYRLNTTAAFIWCCRDEGLAPLAIATALAGKFGIATSLARRDIVRTLSEWRSLGLLDDFATEVRKCRADDTQVGSKL